MICNLCPRRCGVLRTETEGEGWCRMPALPVAARAALHHWEEPPISGKRGSGTVFFSGCSLGCVFCQNEAISHRDFGKALTAGRYSAAPDYPGAAQAAIEEMFRQTGPCQFDEAGLLTRGVVIRHLILPGQTDQAKAVMDWVARTFPKGAVLFSLMSQYTPWGDLSAFPELDRRLRRGEMESCADYMRNLDLPGFCQERTSAREEYTPPFDLTGL